MIPETKPCSLLSMFGAVKRALLVVNNVHGSGFDGDWTMEIRQIKNKPVVVLHGSYHMMDENGFYDGWCDFEVRLPADNISGWAVVYGRKAPWNKIYKYYLQETIEHMVQDHISNYEIELMTSKLEISKLYYFKGILK